MNRPVLLGIAWLAATLSASAADSLFTNSTFTSARADRPWPERWGSPAAGNGRSWEHEEDLAFLRLAARGPERRQMLTRSVKVSPEAVPALELTLRYRRSGEAEPPALIWLFRDRSGALLGHEEIPLSGKPGEWIDLSSKLRLPAGTAQISVLAGWAQGGSGTLDLATLAATPIDSPKDLPEAAPRQREEIPINGDFAKATAEEGWPAEWGRPVPGLSWEKGFLRLVSQQPGQSLMLNRKVPLPAGLRGVEVVIRWRSSGVRFGEHEWFDARTIIHFLDTQGQVLPAGKSLDIVFTHKPEPTDWAEHTQFLRVPDGATTLELRPGLFQAKAGTVDLARVAVYAVGEADSRLLDLASAAAAESKAEEDAEADRNFETRLQAQLAATGNLVANGTFRAQDPKAVWPDAWGKSPPPGLSWQKDGERAFVRLESHDESKTVMLYKMVPLTSGARAVEVLFRYRTAEIAPGAEQPGDARVALHFLDGTRIGHLENGKNLEPDPEPILFSAEAKDWTEVKQTLLVPPGATKLQLMPGLWKTKAGRLDLAEIRVVPHFDCILTSPHFEKAP